MRTAVAAFLRGQSNPRANPPSAYDGLPPWTSITPMFSKPKLSAGLAAIEESLLHLKALTTLLGRPALAALLRDVFEVTGAEDPALGEVLRRLERNEPPSDEAWDELLRAGWLDAHPHEAEALTLSVSQRGMIDVPVHLAEALLAAGEDPRAIGARLTRLFGLFPVATLDKIVLQWMAGHVHQNAWLLDQDRAGRTVDWDNCPSTQPSARAWAARVLRAITKQTGKAPSQLYFELMCSPDAVKYGPREVGRFGTLIAANASGSTMARRDFPPHDAFTIPRINYNNLKSSAYWRDTPLKELIARQA